MEKKFDTKASREFLQNRELEEKEHLEIERKKLLELAKNHLVNLLSTSNTEVYLVGSITQPYMFHSGSDIDVVVKNFKGDRFDLWTKLESSFNRNVEVIIFEDCHFQDHILKNGSKVL